MNIQYVVVECPNCGEKYHASSDYREYPKMCKVCDTCDMPFEIENPFYEEIKEGMRDENDV